MPPMLPDSDLVTHVSPGRGYLRGKLLPRGGAPRAIVIHTTGGGVIRRYEREGERRGDRNAFDTATRIYRTLMDASGHYVVGQAGQVAQIVPEDLCAWHVGGGKSAAYWGGGWWRRQSKHRWWAERWPGLLSPRELAGGGLWDPYVVGPSLGQRIRAPRSWGRGSCNAWSIGIEVEHRAEWTPEAWASLAALITDIATRHGIPLERDRVITHSDAHPIARTSRGAPWDTTERQWTWERMRMEISA